MENASSKVNIVKYIIRKGSYGLPLFWGVDGWVGNSALALKYSSKREAENAIHLLGIWAEDVWIDPYREDQ